MEVSTDPVESGEDVPEDLASSSYKTVMIALKEVCVKRNTRLNANIYTFKFHHRSRSDYMKRVFEKLIHPVLKSLIMSLPTYHHS